MAGLEIWVSLRLNLKAKNLCRNLCANLLFTKFLITKSDSYFYFEQGRIDAKDIKLWRDLLRKKWVSVDFPLFIKARDLKLCVFFYSEYFSLCKFHKTSACKEIGPLNHAENVEKLIEKKIESAGKVLGKIKMQKNVKNWPSINLLCRKTVLEKIQAIKKLH